MNCNRRVSCLVILVIVTGFADAAFGQEHGKVPDHIPPRRTSQIQDGFGINSDLPRDPYLPWDRWWWTRMFDAGFKWIRIGQYENSTDRTSWDWIEQKRGVFAGSPELEDEIDSLVDNGMQVQVQLLYGNAMYTSPSGKRPDVSVPEPGSFHNDDRSLYSVFWPPTTPEQIAAFNRYAEWMVKHFHDRIHYWALWNEQDIGYWNPYGNAEQYGRLLAPFVETVHKSDPQARVIYGGQADPGREFTQKALEACKCAAGIDVYAYHTYPGYGHNMNPETMDSGAYNEPTRVLREAVRRYPGIRADIPFFDDEFNSIGAWTGSDDSVQTKYIPRGMVYNLAFGVKTFVWLLTAGTDGNEYDDFGFIHGLRNLDTDFTPRPVWSALANTNAIFADTKTDAGIEISSPDFEGLQKRSGFPVMAYGFRSRTGKAVVAYWMAAHSEPGNKFVPSLATLRLKDTGIKNPVLVDITSGEIKAIAWKMGTSDTLENVPVKDSIMAIADQNYFDWPVLPETPSSLRAVMSGNSVKLTWEVHGSDSTGVVVERRNAEGKGWVRVASLGPAASEYNDDHAGAGVSYRVRSVNGAGESAYSNIVRVGR